MMFNDYLRKNLIIQILLQFNHSIYIAYFISTRTFNVVYTSENNYMLNMQKDY